MELIVDKEAENNLKLLCSLSSKLWNEVNYARRGMFFEKKEVDLKSTYREFLREVQEAHRLCYSSAGFKQE